MTRIAELSVFPENNGDYRWRSTIRIIGQTRKTVLVVIVAKQQLVLHIQWKKLGGSLSAIGR